MDERLASTSALNTKIDELLGTLKEWKQMWGKRFPDAYKVIDSPLARLDDFPTHLFCLLYDFSDLIRGKGYAFYQSSPFVTKYPIASASTLSIAKTSLDINYPSRCWL